MNTETISSSEKEKSGLTSLQDLPRKKRLLTFMGVSLAMFLASIDQTIISTAMPRIISDLGGFSHYTWVSSAYIISSAVIMPITGRLTDLYGRKFFYLLGMVVFLLSSFACGFSQDMTQLIISRAIKGLGAGIMMATGFTVIGDLFSPAERGKYIGFGSAVFAVSSIIGPTLGGLITDLFSWPWVFFINIPLCVFVIVLFLVYFPNIKPKTKGRQIDFAGILALVLMVVPTMLALTWGGVEYPWDSFIIRSMFLFSLLMLICFFKIESTCKEPIIPLALFKNRIVAVALIVTFLTGFTMYSIIIFIPLYFQGVLAATATVSGNFLTPMMLGLVLGSFISGQLLSRTGGHYKLQSIVGLIVYIAGIALLSEMNTQTHFSLAVFNISMTGLGLGAILPLYTICVQNAVPYQLLGVATSATAFFRSLGGAFGLAVLGSVMNGRFIAEFMTQIPPAIKSVLPESQLLKIAHNPQLLVSPERQAALKTFLEKTAENGTLIYESLIMILRQACQMALSQIFLASLLVMIAAFLINLFLKEIPLRKKHQ